MLATNSAPGIEIGMTSTKAFTTQLAGLFLLTLALAPQIISWAEDLARMENALFLGRGLHYPIAMEGALKLKEISYIHAEAYTAGELKHGAVVCRT